MAFIPFGPPSTSLHGAKKDAGSQWRPPQWAKPAMVSVTVPPAANQTNATDINAAPVSPVNGVTTIAATVRHATTYVFDAVLALDHDQALAVTKHPVQTGASISSHAYLEPATLVLYVLMSDVAQQYAPAIPSATANVYPWTGNPSKSVSAYLQVLALQALRVPLSVTTRLRTYKNMLITRIAPREDEKTITGARFRIEFSQIFLATTSITPPVSVRPNDTDTTGLGPVSPSPVPATTQTQFGVHAYGSGNVQLPPDLNDGSIPAITDGVPGYLSAPGSGQPTFTPQYPNSVPAVDVPGAGTYASTPPWFASAVYLQGH